MSKNIFQRTNAVYNTITQFSDLKAGRVFFRGNAAFVKLATPIPSDLICSKCKQAVWNAHNFSNAVHFCPNQERVFGITDFIIDFPTTTSNE